MAEGMSEYEQRSAELRAIAGPLEYLVDSVQDGIEVQALRESKGGQVLIAQCCRAIKACMEVILDPNTQPVDLTNAITELRVQHRVLEMMSTTIAAGRQAGRIMAQSDEPAESPQEELI